MIAGRHKAGQAPGVIDRQAKDRQAAPGRALDEPRLRLRIHMAENHLGPGKIDLLEAIGRTGSISAAGRDMGMSYRRAWLLVDAVNGLYNTPVVLTAAGGAHGGGARLTDFGRDLVAAYRRIEARAAEAMREEMAPFEAQRRS